MKTYVCSNCNRTFDEDDMGVGKEWIGEGGGGLGHYSSQSSGWYSYGVCPHCGSDSIEEAEQCERCEEWFGEWDLTDIADYKWCENCIKEVKDAINAYEALKWAKITNKKAAVGAATK